MENETTAVPELYTTSGDIGSAPVPELINEVPEPELYTEFNSDPLDDYYATTAAPTGGEVALLAGLGVVWFVFMFGLLAIMIVAFWKIFTKAGEQGWKSLIPLYNTWVLLEISGKPGWWLFLMFIPFVNIVIMIMMYNGLSKSFGKGIGYTLGLIFLSPIFFLMLAFGNAKHIKMTNENDSGASPQGSTPEQAPTQETPPQNPTV